MGRRRKAEQPYLPGQAPRGLVEWKRGVSAKRPGGDLNPCMALCKGAALASWLPGQTCDRCVNHDSPGRAAIPAVGCLCLRLFCHCASLPKRCLERPVPYFSPLDSSSSCQLAFSFHCFLVLCPAECVAKPRGGVRQLDVLAAVLAQWHSDERVGITVAAWGAFAGKLGGRRGVLEMLGKIKPVYCLGVTAGGHPK